MPFSFAKSLNRSLQVINQWFSQTPERALEQAYDAALSIKAIEDEHFEGKTIRPESLREGNRIYRYFEDELHKYLRIVRVRLGEFKTSRSVLSLSDPGLSGVNLRRWGSRGNDANAPENLAVRLEKLRFIDEILERYPRSPENPITALVPRRPTPPVPQQPPNKPTAVSRPSPSSPNNPYPLDPSFGLSSLNRPQPEVDRISDGTSFVPRSILGTFDRLRRELDPKAEQEVVKSFRSSKTKTVLSLRFILLLILVPLLTHQITKNFVVGPIVDQFRPETNDNLFLNVELEEDALEDLERYERRLEFQTLLYNAPRLSLEEKEEKIRERAEDIAYEYYNRGVNAIKNIFSDLLSVVSFAVVIVISKKEIMVLKSFMDDVIYGLSDSAKAFIIILFTDMFVGFHSPHGWEIILEGVSRHFGIPESRDFIYLFIATFPVILDTVFKYWIFRYLNRISPSAVATYRNMNE